MTPVYIKGASDLMQKGELLPSQRGLVVVEYQKPITFTGQTHEELKKQVEASLKEAEARWAGKKMRRGGYSILWCAVPVGKQQSIYSPFVFLLLLFLPQCSMCGFRFCCGSDSSERLFRAKQPNNTQL